MKMIQPQIKGLKETRPVDTGFKIAIRIGL